MERYGDMKNKEGYPDPTAGAVIRQESAQVPQVKRGEIYYIKIPHATGHEMEKDRPGIVVSCDELNETSPCVVVVYCSSNTKRYLPEHVPINSTPKNSTAMCEHIYTVDKTRIGRFIGQANAKEMEAVGVGIMAGLRLRHGELARPQEVTGAVPVPKSMAEGTEVDSVKVNARDALRMEAELHIYRGLYENLLDRLTRERSEGA